MDDIHNPTLSGYDNPTMFTNYSFVYDSSLIMLHPLLDDCFTLPFQPSSSLNPQLICATPTSVIQQKHLEEADLELSRDGHHSFMVAPTATASSPPPTHQLDDLLDTKLLRERWITDQSSSRRTHLATETSSAASIGDGSVPRSEVKSKEEEEEEEEEEKLSNTKMSRMANTQQSDYLLDTLLLQERWVTDSLAASMDDRSVWRSEVKSSKEEEEKLSSMIRSRMGNTHQLDDQIDTILLQERWIMDRLSSRRNCVATETSSAALLGEGGIRRSELKSKEGEEEGEEEILGSTEMSRLANTHQTDDLLDTILLQERRITDRSSTRRTHLTTETSSAVSLGNGTIRRLEVKSKEEEEEEEEEEKPSSTKMSRVVNTHQLDNLLDTILLQESRITDRSSTRGIHLATESSSTASLGGGSIRRLEVKTNGEEEELNITKMSRASSALEDLMANGIPSQQNSSRKRLRSWEWEWGSNIKSANPIPGLLQKVEPDLTPPGGNLLSQKMNWSGLTLVDIQSTLSMKKNQDKRILPLSDAIPFSITTADSRELLWKKLKKRSSIEPRNTLNFKCETEALEDGYRWRKYGQKFIKSNPHPRSYYRCTHPKCLVKKQVERSPLGDILVTIDGIHLHHRPSQVIHPNSNIDPSSSSSTIIKHL